MTMSQSIKHSTKQNLYLKANFNIPSNPTCVFIPILCFVQTHIIASTTEEGGALWDWLHFWSYQRRIMLHTDFTFGTKTTRKWIQSKRFSLFIFTHRRPNYQSVPWLLVRWVDYLHTTHPLDSALLTLLLSVEILSYRSHHAVKIFSFHWQIGYEPCKQCIKTVSKIGLMPN